MLKRQAYKFRVNPTGAHVRLLRRMTGCCRFVYNKALSTQKEHYEACGKKLSCFDVNNLLPSWKKEHPFLSEAPSQALQQTIKDMDSAYKNFFAKRAAFPKFKKKNSSNSMRLPQGVSLDQTNSRVFSPKLGWIRYTNSRQVLGDIKNVTISQKNGYWYISIQTELEVEDVVHPSTSSIGLDMGITHFVTSSNGLHIPPLNSFRTKQAKLKKYQRAMSRKVKFSKNWTKAKARVQKLHSHIAYARMDFLHKATNTISKNHALVFVEDLQIKNMSASSTGTVENPGRNVKQKSGLNKAILDQGWFEFRRQLEYKLAWRGGQLIAVPPQYTSQTCPCCKHVSKENRKSQSMFICVACGYTNNADIVGAMNIKAAGHAVLACGEVVQSGASVKQEPAEETTHENA